MGSVCALGKGGSSSESLPGLPGPAARTIKPFGSSYPNSGLFRAYGLGFRVWVTNHILRTPVTYYLGNWSPREGLITSRSPRQAIS